ncbi:MAG: nucleotidyltransferase domain-containing protein [bacterium]
MIRKELLSLEEAGIFEYRKKGNLVYFYLNKSFPLFDELKSIVFKTIGISGALKEGLSKLKGIEVAFIYGSFAKGEEYSDSDIDLCIIGEPSETDLISIIRELEETIRREINYTVYDRNDFNKRKRQKGSFINNLLKENKIFLIGSEDGL